MIMQNGWQTPLCARTGNSSRQPGGLCCTSGGGQGRGEALGFRIAAVLGLRHRFECRWRCSCSPVGHMAGILQPFSTPPVVELAGWNPLRFHSPTNLPTARRRQQVPPGCIAPLAAYYAQKWCASRCCPSNRGHGFRRRRPAHPPGLTCTGPDAPESKSHRRRAPPAHGAPSAPANLTAARTTHVCGRVGGVMRRQNPISTAFPPS